MDQGGKAMGNTAMPLLSTAYDFNNCRIAARLAKLLGKPDDGKMFVALGEKVKHGFNEKFLDPVAGTYAGGVAMPRERAGLQNRTQGQPVQGAVSDPIWRKQ